MRVPSDRRSERAQKASGLSATIRRLRANSSIMHAEATVGESIVTMGEPTDEITPMRASIFLRGDDADATYRKAIQVGGTLVSEPTA